MKTLADLGEFELIARIAARVATDEASPRSRDVVLGIGDDAAILRPRAGEDLVVSSDTLVEGVHFSFGNQAAVDVGRRALAVNLSDLAAMGARPLACTLALCGPGDLALRQFDGLIRGFLREAESFSCPLVGGNLSRASEVSLAVTVMGAVKRGRALRRGGLAPGDRLFVTGVLGRATLARLAAEASGATLRHLPSPRVAAGLALARMKGVGACIDVSDGLLADLGHLLGDSGLGAEIDSARVPRPRGFGAACARLGLDPEPVCLTGGEDYELLFSLREGTRTAGLSKRLGVAVTEIGSVVAAPGVHGVPHLAAGSGGWKHF